VPVGILALLLGNQLASQYLTARQDELSGVTGGTRVRAAQRTVGQQQAFLAATCWTRPSVNSLCADRLAATLPAGVQLLTVDINPAQELLGQGTGAAPHFCPGVVTVRGQCASAQQFNAWLQRLTRQPWVRAVRDQNFAYNYAGGLGTFTLLLDEEALTID
jgi:Tfp pilus assembly protein PilN